MTNNSNLKMNAKVVAKAVADYAASRPVNGTADTRGTLHEIANQLGLGWHDATLAALREELTAHGFTMRGGRWAVWPQETYRGHAEARRQDRIASGRAGRPYKGRNAKLAVIGFRLTDYELDEIAASIAKANKAARKLGAKVGYVRSDMVRAAVLDFARWINEPGEQHMAKVIEILEDQFK